MDDREKYTRENSVGSRITKEEVIRENEDLEKRNILLKYLLGVVGIVILAVLIIAIFSGPSDYENGMAYLNQKQYTEAIYEFNKVEPEDSEFIMAQSKINYIKGLMAYEQGNEEQAVNFLMNVNPSDEYYAQSAAMIEKYNLAKKISDIEAMKEQVNNVRDTIIIKKEESDEVANETEKAVNSESTVTEGNKKMIDVSEKMFVEFDNHFQTAKNFSIEKRDEYIASMDSLYNTYINTSMYKSNDPALVEINQTAVTWMQNSIKLLNDPSYEKSLAGNEKTKKLSEENDKLYSKLFTIIRKYQS